MEGEEMLIDIIELRRMFHKIPEVGFKEYETNMLIRRILDKYGVKYKADIAGTGLIISYGEGHPHIAFRAEIDALPIQEENNVEYCSTKDGYMHACGHDCHIAALIGTVVKTKEIFEKSNIQGKVTFIFQPCEETHNEEGLSGGQIISSLPELESVDHFYAGHIESTLENGKIFIREGALTAAIDRFDAEVIGRPGHGAYPHNTVDPIWLAANTIQMINTIESRVANTAYPSVISVCTISGGNTWNTIPEKVSMSGTIRSFNQKEREKIHDRMTKCFESCRLFGGDFNLNIEKGNPSVVNDSNECNFVREAVRNVINDEAVSSIDIQMGGDDFSYYAMQKPSCYFYIGAKKDDISRQHHSGNFDIDESMIPYISRIYMEIIRMKLL